MLPTSEEKKPYRVQCEPCAHRWIAAYTPMEMGLFGKVLKGIRCPMCGAGSRRIFLDAEHP